jgi:hypothetical protein
MSPSISRLATVATIILNVVIFLGHNFCLGKLVTLRASHTIIRLAGDISKNNFLAWFSRPETPLEILALNPGFEKVERLSDTVCRGYLTPILFPGLSITSVVDFNVTFNGRVLTLNADGSSMKQTLDGSPILKAFMSRLPLPSVKSTSVIAASDSDEFLTNRAELEISFPYPDWFPIPANMIEQKGSETIQSKIITDLDDLFKNILDCHERWLQNEAIE